jgi:hypothetical protein
MSLPARRQRAIVLVPGLSAAATRFVTRTAGEQALSPLSATEDTSGVC